MKVGQQVAYVAHDGSRCSASVVAIAGSGPSGCKILGLTWGESGEHCYGSPEVQHAQDAAPGEAYWHLLSEVIPPRAVVADVATLGVRIQAEGDEAPTTPAKRRKPHRVADESPDVVQESPAEAASELAIE